MLLIIGAPLGHGEIRAERKKLLLLHYRMCGSVELHGQWTLQRNDRYLESQLACPHSFALLYLYFINRQLRNVVIYFYIYGIAIIKGIADDGAFSQCEYPVVVCVIRSELLLLKRGTKDHSRSSL